MIYFSSVIDGSFSFVYIDHGTLYCITALVVITATSTITVSPCSTLLVYDDSVWYTASSIN